MLACNWIYVFVYFFWNGLDEKVMACELIFSGLFAPVVNENGDLIVDGGLLCHYPIHCYDGMKL